MLRWLLLVLALAAACKKREAPAAPLNDDGPGRPDAPAETRASRATKGPAGAPQPLGGALNVDAAASAGDPDLVLDAVGAPVVAWIESGAIRVKRWTGADWELLGPIPGAAGRATSGRPSLALEADGGLLVGWSEPGDDDVARLRIARWKDGAWTSLGGLHDVGAAEDGAVTGSSFGPVAIWRERHANTQQATIFVRAHVAGNWTAPGEGRLKVAADGDVRTAPALAGRKDGSFALAWVEHDKAGNVVAALRRWDLGTATWETLPDPPGVDEESTIDLAQGADGALICALGFADGLRPIAALAPGATSWIELGVAEPPPAQVSGARVATLTGNEVALAVPYGEARLAYHDGARWTPLPLAVPAAAVAAPTPAIAPDGAVYAAVSIAEPERPAQLRVYVAR
jgi:hypothetical protein